MSYNTLANTAPYIHNAAYRRPYLNLKERLSQVWLNYYTVFLLLILLKVIMFKQSLNQSLNQAKDQTYSACDSAETYASSMASLPHYLAKSTNVLAAKTMNEVNHAFVEGLQLIVTGSESLIVFAIEMTIGTYTCVLTSAVDGVSHIALNATESVIELANHTMVSIADDIQDGLDDITSIVNKVLSTVDTATDAIESLFGGSSDSSDAVDEKVHSVNLTIDSLKNWTISSSIIDDIDAIGNKVPDFSTVENYTKSLINKPFEKLKTEIAEKLNDTFSADEMFIPEKKQLNFCRSSNDIEQFYAKSGDALHKASIIMIIVLIVGMVVFIGIEAYSVIRQWKRLEDAAGAIQNVSQSRTSGEYKQQYTIEVVESLHNKYANSIGTLLGKLVGACYY
ncbi:unnamed protein product [Ambrosiozyma monospora]|uniref:Unnamed protein product n=1 Tax=Ambrosiozyma monospora TaxID=43982 RepID=A0ACB5TD31_AMBMO|nr:unnamed protein product [Ambrosiozyma monospora]